MKEVKIYADGGCRGNGKAENVGGYGAVLIYGEFKKEIRGSEKNTTNNIMELKSVIAPLKMLKEKCSVEVYSDSQYVVDAFNQNWISGWVRNGWKNSKKEAVKNKELWLELLQLTAAHEIKFIKVKGHSGNAMNERCDVLANIAMDECI